MYDLTDARTSVPPSHPPLDGPIDGSAAESDGVDVEEVLALAQDTGRDQTYEFELYVLRWQRELAAAHAREAERDDGPCALEAFARREAAALRERMERY